MKCAPVVCSDKLRAGCDAPRVQVGSRGQCGGTDKEGNRPAVRHPPASYYTASLSTLGT